MAEKSTLKSIKDVAAIGRDLAYVFRSLIFINKEMVGPASDIARDWIAQAGANKALPEDELSAIRERVEALPDGDEKEKLRELLGRGV